MNVPDNDILNQEKFMEILRVADPELYLLKMTLKETKINPMILNHVLRTMGNMLIGTGYGTIKIYMQAKRISNIEGTEKTLIEDDTIVE
jgi:hypothetical protein